MNSEARNLLAVFMRTAQALRPQDRYAEVFGARSFIKFSEGDPNALVDMIRKCLIELPSQAGGGNPEAPVRSFGGLDDDRLFEALRGGASPVPPDSLLGETVDQTRAAPTGGEGKWDRTPIRSFKDVDDDSFLYALKGNWTIH